MRASNAVIFSCVIALMTVGQSAGQSATIDKARLEQMRLSVESATSRIQNVKFEYVVDWQADLASAMVQEIVARQRAILQERLKAATNPTDRDAINKWLKNYETYGGNVRIAYKLTYAFPSVRTERTVLEQVGDSWEPSIREVRAINNGRFTSFNYKTKSAATSSHVSNTNLSMFTRLPPALIGLRSYPVDGPDNQTLESLLSHPHITSVEGHDSIRGIATIRLRIGPRIPEATRPGGLGEGGYVIVWLAPAYNHFAIKKEFHIASSEYSKQDTGNLVHVVELDDFRPTTDKVRHTKLFLPFLMTYRDPAGTTSYRVSSITINDSLASTEFNPVVPEGFSLSIDGASQVRLAGGESAKRRITSESVKKARALLDMSPPQAQNIGANGHLAMWGVLACAAVLSTFYFLLRRLRDAH